jgi:hypothetical protein
VLSFLVAIVVSHLPEVKRECSGTPWYYRLARPALTRAGTGGRAGECDSRVGPKRG